MKKFPWVAVLFIAPFLVIVPFLAGCGATSSSRIESDLRIKGAPEWVQEGTRAVKNKRGRLLHGIGVATPLSDPSLQANVADNRARAEIASVLSTYIDQLTKDYSQSVDGGFSSDITREITSQSKNVLAGSVIKARWKDKRTGNLYSFAELDSKRIDSFIQSSTTLTQGFKDFYAQEGPRTFDDLGNNS